MAKAPCQEKPLAHGTRAAKREDTVAVSGDAKAQRDNTAKLVTVGRNVWMFAARWPNCASRGELPPRTHLCAGVR